METGYSISDYDPASLSLNRTMQYGNAYFLLKENKEKKFKSYYVVWKLFFIKHFVNKNKCLNRTMQYGNLFLPLSILPLLFSLNRTMQYGNLFFCVRRVNDTKRFKSYYVVWKPLAPTAMERTIQSLNRTMQYGNIVPA